MELSKCMLEASHYLGLHIVYKVGDNEYDHRKATEAEIKAECDLIASTDKLVLARLIAQDKGDVQCVRDEQTGGWKWVEPETTPQQIWNRAKVEILNKESKHGQIVGMYSPDGKFLSISYLDGSLVFWTIRRGHGVGYAHTPTPADYE